MPANQDTNHIQGSLTERLERCYTGVVHDVMRSMGLRDFTLPPEKLSMWIDGETGFTEQWL
jgi:hypothetical protein